MKKFNFLLMLVSLFVALFSTSSCNNEETGVLTPEIMLTAGSVTQTSLSFTAETSVAEKAYYLVVKAADEQVVDGMTVVSTGTEIVKADGSAWVNDAASVTVKDLEPETEYLVYAAAVNGPETTLVDAPLSMTTSDKSMPTVSLEAVEAEDSKLYFRVTTAYAAEVKWLAVPADTEVTADKVLAEGVALAEKDLNKTAMVKAENLSDDTAYDIYAVAKAEDRVTLSESITMRTLPTPPTVELELIEAGSTYAAAFVRTTNAEEVKWAYAPHGYEGVTADLVYQAGDALSAEEVGSGEAIIEIEELDPATSYDLYAVAKRGDVLVLSETLTFTTEEASAGGDMVQLSVVFDTASMMDPSQHGIGGFYFLQLRNSQTNDMALLPVYDLSGASYLDGYYPVVAQPTSEDVRFVAQTDANIGSAFFMIGGKEYYLLPGVDPHSQPYGIQFLTLMGQGEDNNMITLNLMLCDENANPAAELLGQCYMGPLGYSGAGAMAQAERDLTVFKEYTMTVAEDGKTVTLRGTSYMGDIKLILSTENGSLVEKEGEGNGVNYSVEGGTISTESYYWEPLDDWTFKFTQGNLYIEKVAGKDNTYAFTMSSRRGGLVAEMQQPQALQLLFTPLDVAWEVTITK